jgi:hypothetical protein
MRPFRIASATARPENLPPLLDQVAHLGPGRRPAYRDRLQNLPKLSVHSRLLKTLAARPSPSGTKCRTAPRSGAAPPSVTHTRLSNALSPFRQNATAAFGSTRALKRRFSRSAVICVDHAAPRPAAEPSWRSAGPRSGCPGARRRDFQAQVERDGHSTTQARRSSPAASRTKAAGGSISRTPSVVGASGHCTSMRPRLPARRQSLSARSAAAAPEARGSRRRIHTERRLSVPYHRRLRLSPRRVFGRGCRAGRSSAPRK